MTKSSRTAMLIVVAYAVASLVWIALTADLLPMTAGDRRLLLTFEQQKGLLYVAITGLFFFLFLSRAFIRREDAQRNLRESEERYRLLFERMLNGFAYCRMIFEGDQPADFIYLEVNRAFETMTGLHHVVGRRVSDVIPGIRTSNPQLLEVYGRVARTGNPETFETYVQPLDMWFSIAVYSPGKEHFVAIFDVITARKRAEESFKLFRALVDHTNDAIEVVDPESGRFLDVNEPGLADLGYSREEFLGLKVFDIDPLVDQAALTGIVKTLREAGSLTWDGIHRRKDGTTFPVEVNLRLARLDRDYLVAVVRDITARRREEDALRLQTAALEAAANGMVITDAESRVVWVNAAFSFMTGYAFDEAIGQNPRILKSEIQKPEFYADMQRTIHEGRVWRGELVNRRKDGSLYSEEMTITPMRAEGGAITHFIAVKQDITERKRAEENARLAERRSRAILDNIPDMAWLKDPEGRFIAVNEVLAKASGLPAGEVVGRTDADLWPEPLARKYREDDLEVMASRQHKAVIEQFVDNNGRTTWIETIKTPIFDELGVVTGTTGIARDVTERRRAEERLRTLAEGLRGVVVAVDELIGCADLDVLFRRAVELAREKLSVERCAIFVFDARVARGTFGTDMSGRVVDEHGNTFEIQPEWEEHFATVSPERSRWVLKEDAEQWNWDGRCSSVIGRGWVAYTAIARSGERAKALFIRDTAITKAPFDPVKQEVITVYCSLLGEIIERRRSEAALRESESRYRALSATLEHRVKERTHAAEAASRAKSQFLASMSHELRTPLNSVIGFSQLLGEKKFGDLSPRQLRYVQNIEASGRHLLYLINDILDLSKIEAGRVALFVEPMDVARAMSDAAGTVSPLAARKDIKLTCDVAPGLPPVPADEARFRQIMYNLLSNAIKFTHNGGKVMVTAKQVPGNNPDARNEGARPAGAPDPRPHLLISVADTGIGIKTADRERVFWEFTQVDSTYARQQEGTGLGLALVRKFVEMHGGRVWVESEGVEGRGSVFSFVIPIVHAPAEAHPAGAKDAGATRLLLVIEDEPMMIKIMTQAVQKAGFRSVQAVNGREGLARAVEHKPGVIVVDLVMPGMNGFDLIQEFRALSETRSTPIVVFTGRQLNEEELSRLKGQVSAIVYKPDLERLIAAISDLTGGAT